MAKTWRSVTTAKSFFRRIFSLANYGWMCLVIVITIICVSVLNWSSQDRYDIISNSIAGGGLLFAMLVGLFSFNEYRISKREKDNEQAMDLMHSGNFNEAREKFASAYKLGLRNFDFLTNYSELLSILGDFGMARQMALLSKSYTSSMRDNYLQNYLLILSSLVSKQEDKLRKHLKRLLQITKGEKILTIQWSFDELKKSEVHKTLQTSGKSVLDSIERFFTGKIDRDEFEKSIKKIRWIDG